MSTFCLHTTSTILHSSNISNTIKRIYKKGLCQMLRNHSPFITLSLLVMTCFAIVSVGSVHLSSTCSTCSLFVCALHTIYCHVLTQFDLIITFCDSLCYLLPQCLLFNSFFRKTCKYHANRHN